jgi:hypothetical protein
MVRLPKLRSTRRLMVAMVITGLVAAPGLVLASDLFADVPNTSAFHAPIGAIARAGVTTGCGDGLYCPTSNVSREQMAAFMHRGFARVASDDVSGMTFSTAPTNVLSLSITPGLPTTAVPGAKNFISVNATVSLWVPTLSGCQCFYEVYLTHNGTQIGEENYVSINTTNEIVNIAVTGIAQVTASGGQSISVVVDQYFGSSNTFAYGNLTAMTAPFGATGTNVLPFDGADADLPRPGE